MPVHIKIIVSILTLVVAGVMYYFETKSGGGAVRWVVLALGPFAVVSMWVFPEAKGGEIKKELASRRR